MSRSNPTVDNPNPATRWFEWNGEEGTVRYYDKNAVLDPEHPDKKGGNITVGDGFTFILLDETATVKGWDETAEKGIYSNEVRSTVNEPLVVKYFKGGVLATGFYSTIKDKVAAKGGYFVANLYIAYKEGKELVIGALQLKGSGLNAWVEFRNKHRGELYKQAVQIKGYTEGKKGKVTFRVPVFHIKPLGEDSNAKAVELDKTLQEYLKGYFTRTKAGPEAASPPPPPEHAQEEQAHAEPPAAALAAPAAGPTSPAHPEPAEPVEDDVPF